MAVKLVISCWQALYSKRFFALPAASHRAVAQHGGNNYFCTTNGDKR